MGCSNTKEKKQIADLQHDFSEAKKALDSNSFQIQTISKDISDVRESLTASTAKLHADIKKELEGTRLLNEKIVGTINILNRDLTEVKQDITGVKEQINLEKQQLVVLKSQIDHAMKRERARLESLRVGSESVDAIEDDVKHWTDVPMQFIDPFTSLFVPAVAVESLDLLMPDDVKDKKSRKAGDEIVDGHPWTDYEKDIDAAAAVDDKLKKPSWSDPIPRKEAPPTTPYNSAASFPSAVAGATFRQSAGPKRVTIKVAYTKSDGLGMILVNAEPGDFEGRKIARLRVKAFRANLSGGPSASELAGVKAGDILEQVDGSTFETSGQLLHKCRDIALEGNGIATLVFERK